MGGVTCACGAEVERIEDWAPDERGEYPGGETECRRCAYARWVASEQLGLEVVE